MSLFKRYYPVLVAVLVAVLPLGMNTYWTEVAVNVGLYALLALSLNVILGQAGIFHMGHAAFYAVGAYVTAILNTHYQIPILLLIPVAGAAAALFALIVARPIIHLRGDHLLIVTIGIVEIVRIALINDVFGLTGGANGIFGIARPELFGIKIRKAIQFYYLIWIMVGLTVLLFHWLSESRFGRALNCIKEDDTAAEGCGLGGHGREPLCRQDDHHFPEFVYLLGIGGGLCRGHPLRRQPDRRLARHVPHRGPAGNVP